VHEPDTHFDRVARRYEETIAPHVMEHLTRRRVQLATSLAALGRVLDVGCGTGRFLVALPDRYERVGVDISEGMLELARRRGLDVTRASSGSLPYEDASFDLVTTFAVLHHLIDPELVRATLHEMCRVVKPGASVLVWDHNPLNPYWPLLMRRLPQDRGDEKLVPAERIRAALREAGMVDLRLRRLTFVPDFTPPWALRAAAALERRLERIPGVNLLGAHNVAVARRPLSRRA
jgi:SAM-dependent methyltransferase